MANYSGTKVKQGSIVDGMSASFNHGRKMGKPQAGGRRRAITTFYNAAKNLVITVEHDAGDTVTAAQATI